MESTWAIAHALVLDLIESRVTDSRYEFVDGPQPESMAGSGIVVICSGSPAPSTNREPGKRALGEQHAHH
ncbi:hypothetical protein Y900_018960 [Mycolicibacterium aromaticivorans JS19b1 = JCM 16368]|uniref:Uncharacterized protein n=1 Tax=Mycolicibacterium aromaticivorans JS19b1 = JCM 16368 TaxID=1440774 RepID=A0A064CKT1_9MYCO|nr:hypothetical protein [Mycolicibacterium aromaticivorans]KDF00956.1 hypothetical protein Y900_018960 [Mycolicibacterium aromaticivorans JS19b1 = JCM 16368]